MLQCKRLILVTGALGLLLRASHGLQSSSPLSNKRLTATVPSQMIAGHSGRNLFGSRSIESPRFLKASSHDTSNDQRWTPLTPAAKIFLPLQLVFGIYLLLLLPSGLAMGLPCGARAMSTLPYEYIAFFSALLLPRSFRYGKFSKPRKAGAANKGTSLRDLLVFISVLVVSHFRAAYRHALSGRNSFLAPRLMLAMRIIATLLVGASGWHLGRSYDRVARPHELVTTGPYSIVRHPIYSAYLLLFSGGLLTLRAYGGCAALLVAASLFYSPRMNAEDQLLEDTFGEEFQSYKQEVPWRLIPFLF